MLDFSVSWPCAVASHSYNLHASLVCGKQLLGGGGRGCTLLFTPSAPRLPLADTKNLPGVTAPFEGVFDPAGFLATASIKDVRRWRESEITHGRVAMLAALGFVVGEQLQDFPLFFSEFGAAWEWACWGRGPCLG